MKNYFKGILSSTPPILQGQHHLCNPKYSKSKFSISFKYKYSITFSHKVALFFSIKFPTYEPSKDFMSYPIKPYSKFFISKFKLLPSKPYPFPIRDWNEKPLKMTTWVNVKLNGNRKYTNTHNFYFHWVLEKKNWKKIQSERKREIHCDPSKLDRASWAGEGRPCQQQRKKNPTLDSCFHTSYDFSILFSHLQHPLRFLDPPFFFFF